jgi:hypothetical protein
VNEGRDGRGNGRDEITLFLIRLRRSVDSFVMSVPMRMGDFEIAQIAKCVRSSAAVSFPFPMI